MSQPLPYLEPGIYRIEYQADHCRAGQVVTVLEAGQHGEYMYMLKMLDCDGNVATHWTYPYELKRLDK